MKIINKMFNIFQKGGRISAATAFAGEIMSIKPVVVVTHVGPGAIGVAFFATE